MISKAEAKILYDYYSNLIVKLTDAKLKLASGGVKSYTIDDRSLTQLDLNLLTADIDDAVRKRAEYEAILNGRAVRKAVAVVPRDF